MTRPVEIVNLCHSGCLSPSLGPICLDVGWLPNFRLGNHTSQSEAAGMGGAYIVIDHYTPHCG